MSVQEADTKTRLDKQKMIGGLDREKQQRQRKRGRDRARLRMDCRSERLWQRVGRRGAVDGEP